ncbi:PIG-L deacetylase family protein [Hymenobacter caeli]|uniref:LmbE family N-acetylglucosaminyl deacetylase n=1 Tax=Hymenobacter caeli TaxID=2735894 RepID=A0ABX2FVY8_9BACT|nr:PIG-L family deacetylase [Hymenobacter caeli]NRT20555.1 LmbE family N-acetylglucosaminyl deacetylase [Hymenobacter caeli]
MLPFAEYPLRPAEFAATLGPTVVVVPHPDDEALGCGGLLALLRQAGQPVHVVLVSDGSMSHPQSVLFSAEARRAVREGELRHALALLGVHTEPLPLRLPDGRVPSSPGQPGFAEAAARLRALLLAARPATVLLPWRRDPHPDHRASYQLAQAALAGLPGAPRPLEYVVWAWQRAAPADLPQPADQVAGFRLAIDAVLPHKLRAIAAHRSQVAPGVFTDDAAGFLLADEMLAKFAQPTEVFFEAAP